MHLDGHEGYSFVLCNQIGGVLDTKSIKNNKKGQNYANTTTYTETRKVKNKRSKESKTKNEK